MNKEELINLIEEEGLSLAGDIFRAHITRYKRPDVEVYLNVENKRLTIDASQGDYLIAKIPCTNGHNSWLWDGFAHQEYNEDTEQDEWVLSYEPGTPSIREETLIEECITDGDWDSDYEHFCEIIKSEVKHTHYDFLEVSND